LVKRKRHYLSRCLQGLGKGKGQTQPAATR
jgi:hypothetical protein